MSLADNYPVGMDWCTSQGLNGNCNEECHKVAEMDCKHMDCFDDPVAAIMESRRYHGYHEDEIAETKKEYRQWQIILRNIEERKKHAVSNP